MADNSSIVAGTGDLIRDVQRGGASGPKTAVTLLDFGTTATESIAALTNPFPVFRPDVAVTGTLAALNSAVAVATNVGIGDVGFQFTGTWVGTITLQGTIDPAGTAAASSSWVSINAPAPTIALAPSSTTTSNGVFVVRVGAYTAVRAIMTTYTSGTATVWANASVATNTVAIAEPVTIGSDPDTVASGTITAPDAVVAAPAGTGVLLSGTPTANSYVTVQCPGGDSAWVIQVTGTFGGGTVYFEESADSTDGVNGNWIGVNGRQTGVVNTVLFVGTSVAGFFRGNTSGAKYLRVRLVGGSAPSITAVVRMSAGSGALFLNASVPGGTNVIGRVGPQTSSTSNLSSVTPTATAASMLASNSGRTGWKVYNDSNVDVLLAESGTVSATTYTVRIPAGTGYYEGSGSNVVWAGPIFVVGVAVGTTTLTAAASGALRVTELA